jgi:hypothetical protein
MWKIKNLPGGKYYWSVQAIDHAFAGSEFAPAQSFAVPPAPPKLLSPANVSAWVSVSPTLIWNKSVGTDDYRVQVSSVQNFSTLIYNKSVGVDTSVKIEGLEKGTIYYWRVSAANAGGTSESLVSRFTTVLAEPDLLSPADSAAGISTEVTCRWSVVKGAEFYVLHVARDKSFQIGLQNYSAIADTAFKISGLAPNVVYYWRVAAGHAGKLSNWSQVRFFATITSTVRETTNGEIPVDFKLEQNFPNPFNPTTTIAFALPQSSSVELIIYDTKGAFVAELINHHFAAGKYEVDWKANSLTSGVYFYRLRAGEFVATKTMLFIK